MEVLGADVEVTTAVMGAMGMDKVAIKETAGGITVINIAGHHRLFRSPISAAAFASPNR